MKKILITLILVAAAALIIIKFNGKCSLCTNICSSLNIPSFCSASEKEGCSSEKKEEAPAPAAETAPQATPPIPTVPPVPEVNSSAAPLSAPAWTLKSTDGKSLSSTDFLGKVVILDFWATWCPPCRQEIPAFVELEKAYSEKGLVVIGISLDKNPEILPAFIKENKINYPILIGDEKVVADFGGVQGIPTTFIINREGQIVSKHVGYTAKKIFEKEIQPLL